jgi:putative hydrolase of the HAD superfamily
MTGMPTALLFDAGGTLIRREPTESATLARELQRVGFPLEPGEAERAWYMGEVWAGEQITREINGAPRLERQEFLAGMTRAAIHSLKLPLCEADMEETVSGYFGAHETGRPWTPVPNALETLRTLIARGYLMGLVSNFDNTLRGILGSHGLLHLFSAVIISDEVGVEKPDPAIIGMACDQLSVGPKEAVYIGDHPFDVVCSKQAGVRSVWVRAEYASMPDGVTEVPDWRVREIRDVLDLFTGPQNDEVRPPEVE